MMNNTFRIISLKTKKAGLIGDPLGHSASAAMHGAAYYQMGLDAIYIPMEIPADRVDLAVKSLELLNFMGCNVTLPHKQTVLPLMDELDESAQSCGAVNTILFRGGRKIGYNTDGSGFVRAIKEKAGFDPKGKKCLVIGAGGAARGVTFALAMAGTKEFIILNRAEEIEMAERLSADMNSCRSGISAASVLSHETVSEALKQADFVIHATPLGMTPHEDTVAFDTSLLKPGHAVFDVVYNPRETRLLREAKACGCKTLGGLWMLVYQGIEAIRIWTGKDAPADVMAEAAEKFLTELKC